MSRIISLLAFAMAAVCAGSAMAQAPAPVPAALAVPGAQPVATFQGVGAQIYECKAVDGKLAWVLREPSAALIDNGKTVGRHYAGPTWEDVDGSKIVGNPVGKTPGAMADDVPLLKLDVVKHQGRGMLSKVTNVQRLDTHGGALSGGCDKAGDFKSVAYSATYVFLRKAK